MTDHLDNSAFPPAAASIPGTCGTPGKDYVLTEEDRAALNAVTLTVEFLMVAARAISRGFPQDHPEATQYLDLARLKLPAA